MTPNEGPLYLAGSTTAADDSIGPSARKERGPQDDNPSRIAQFGTLFTTFSAIRLFFASICMYNPARLDFI
jgi:hypothetical protein